MLKRWIPFALIVILLLSGAACDQRTPLEQPAASEASAEPETAPPTEAETDPEPDTEPETEHETEPETAPPTEQATEAVTEPLEPTDPPASLSSGTNLNPGDFDLFAFRSGFEVQWYADHETINSQFAALVNRNTATPAGAADPNIMTEGDFLALLPGYQKVIYSLKAGSLVIGEIAYQTAPEDYAAMKALYDDATLSGATYPQWLVYMDLSRITGARVLTEASGQVAAADSGRVSTISAAARFFPVAPGTGNTSGVVQRQITPKGNTFKLWLDFDGGTGKQGDLFYTLTVEETSLLVESSDLGYGCLYAISPEAAAKLRGVLDQSAHTPLQDPTYATDAAGNPLNWDANPA